MSVSTSADGLSVLGGVIRHGNPGRRSLVDNTVRFYVRVINEPINVSGTHADMILRSGYVAPPDANYSDPSVADRPRLMFMGRILRSSNGLQPHIYLEDPCRLARAGGQSAEFIQKIVALHTAFISEEGFSGIVPNFGDVVQVTLMTSDFTSPDLKVAQFTEVASVQDANLYAENREASCSRLETLFEGSNIHRASGPHAALTYGSYSEPPRCGSLDASFTFQQFLQMAEQSPPGTNRGFRELLDFIARGESGGQGYTAINRGCAGDTSNASALQSHTLFPWWREFQRLQLEDATILQWRASNVPAVFYEHPENLPSHWRTMKYRFADVTVPGYNADGEADGPPRSARDGATYRRSVMLAEEVEDTDRPATRQAPGVRYTSTYRSTGAVSVAAHRPTYIWMSTPGMVTDESGAQFEVPGPTLCGMSVWDVRELQKGNRKAAAMGVPSATRTRSAGRTCRSHPAGEDLDYYMAVGRYQIMPRTLNTILTRYFDPPMTVEEQKKTLFSPTFQDACGIALLLKKRPELGAYLLSGAFNRGTGIGNDIGFHPRPNRYEQTSGAPEVGTVHRTTSLAGNKLANASGDVNLPHTSQLAIDTGQSDCVLRAAHYLALEWMFAPMQYDYLNTDIGQIRSRGQCYSVHGGNASSVTPESVTAMIAKTMILIAHTDAIVRILQNPRMTYYTINDQNILGPYQTWDWDS